MSGHVSLTYPDGSRLVTVSIGMDGSVHVGITDRRGATLHHASGQIDVDRAHGVITDLLIASKLPQPPGHEIAVALYDEPPDPACGETRQGSVWDAARVLAQEVLGELPKHRTGVVPYTFLTFLKWTLLFAVAMGAALAVGEWVGRATGMGLIEASKVVGEFPQGRSPVIGLLCAVILVWFGYGTLYHRIQDTHRSDARPAWPALLGTLPGMFAAYQFTGAIGLIWIVGICFGPLLAVTFGVEVFWRNRMKGRVLGQRF